MRDGISLSADVYLPLGGQGLPTIIQWTPYESTRERFIAWGVWFAQRGYAAVAVDVRGRYESEGDFTAWAKDGRRRAGHRHLGGRASSGRTAGSAPGAAATAALVQWQLRISGHPNVDCIAPQVIHDDYFWDGYWTGGAFQLALTLGAAALWTSAMALITGPSARDLVLNDRIFAPPAADRARRGHDRAQGRLLADVVGAPGERRVLAAVPPPAGEGRRADLPAGRLVRPVLRLAHALFAAIGDRVPNRVLMGPWSHEAEVEAFTADIDLTPALTVIREHELAFYDRYLKEIDNDWEERPPAELYVLGADEWRGESEWPLERTEPTPVPPAPGRSRLSRADHRAPTSRATGTTTTRPTPSRRSAASTRC